MKPRFHKSSLASFTLALTAGLLVTASTAQATTYYWDNNTTTSGFGTAGDTWSSAGSTLWNGDSTGGSAGGLLGTSITTTTADALNFGTATDGLAAGTITVSDTVSTNSLTFGSASGAITLSGGTITFGGTTPTITVDNAAASIGSVIAGGDGLTKSGTGTLTLSNTNTFSGGLSFKQGTIVFTNSSALGSGSITMGLLVNASQDLNFGANGLTLANAFTFQNSQGSKTIRLNLDGTNSGTISGNVDIRIANPGDSVFDVGTADTLTLSGTIYTGAGGGAGLTKTGAGTLDIAGATANTFVGATTVSEGTIVLSKALAIQNSALNTTGAGFVTLNAVTAPTFGGLSNSGTTRDLATVISSGYGSVTNLTLNPGSGTVTYDGVIANGATGMTLTKTGAGTQVLAGINTYTGATTISGGTLALGGGAAIADTGLVEVQNVLGATLRLDSSETIGNLTGGGATGGTVNLQANTLTVGDATNQTFAGKITGTGGSLIKQGTGTLDIQMGTGQYTGTTTINGGTLRFTNVSDLWSVSTTAININNGSTLEFESSVGGANRTVLNNKVFTFGSSGGGTINFDGGNHLFQTGVHTFITTGGLKNTISRTNGAFINNQGSGNTVFDVADGSDEVDLELSAEWRNGTLTKSGAGTMAITGVHLNSLAIAIDTGTLEIGGSSSLNGGTFTATITNDGTFKYNSSAAQTLSGVISGTGALTQSGASTLTLTGANTYNGATTVSAGTLAINGTGSINDSSSVQVAAGATLVYNSSTALTVGPVLNGNTTSNRAVLGGTGSINAAVTLDNVGDTLAPGNSPGVQTFETAQTWSSFSYDWEINNFTGTTAGSDFDQLVLQDTLGLNAESGSYILNILSLDILNAPGDAINFSEMNRSWNILTTTNGITGFDAAKWTINVAGFTNAEAGSWLLAESGGNLVLSYTAIPEPPAALIGGLGMLVLLRRRRA